MVPFSASPLLLTSLLVWFYAQSFWFAALPLGCSIAAVAWQLGLLYLIGYGIDPMSILVPFLVFAIGVSHGVQMVRAFRAELFAAADPLPVGTFSVPAVACAGRRGADHRHDRVCHHPAHPGADHPELAIAASLGVAVIILTNLLLLPLLLSYQKPAPDTATAWPGARCGRVNSGTQSRSCPPRGWPSPWWGSVR
ncbi:MAG: hypothetical protein CM1200mP34_0240 [Verrucomicrobiales bacterium]|nr:MAG: hypothetical protein CM1200mP34_0240 [Verrucomicrobiales bacterium]